MNRHGCRFFAPYSMNAPPRLSLFFSTDASARAWPFALFIAALALRGALGDTATMFDQRWLYAAQVVPALIALLIFAPRFDELRAAPTAAIAWAAALCAGAAVFALWIALDAAWMRIGQPVATFVPQAADGSLRVDLIALRSFGAVIVVPIMEELFWRSFLMRWIDRRAFRELAPQRVSWFALFASAAVFALAHDRWLAGILAGLVYGLLYKHTGRLWYAIAAHALTNALLAAWVVAGAHWEYW